MRKSYLILLLFLSIASEAGNDGSGGGGYLCDNERGEKTVVLVDLWEANLRTHLRLDTFSSIPKNNSPIHQQIEVALKRLDFLNHEFAQKVKIELQHIQNTYVYAPSGVSISAPDDVHPSLTPSGCELVGLATYVDDFWDQEGILWIDESYFNLLQSNTDRAALFIHEAVYRLLRKEPLKATNSIKARKIVGILFAKDRDFENSLNYINNLINNKGE